MSQVRALIWKLGSSPPGGGAGGVARKGGTSVPQPSSARGASRSAMRAKRVRRMARTVPEFLACVKRPVALRDPPGTHDRRASREVKEALMRRVLVVVSLCLPACASGPLSPVKSHTPPEATPPAPKTELAQAAPPGRAARPPRPGRLFDGIERPERAERGEKPAGPHILIPDWGTRGERARSYDLNHIRFAIDFDLTKRHIRGRVTNVVAPFTDDLKAIELDAEELH